MNKGMGLRKEIEDDLASRTKPQKLKIESKSTYFSHKRTKRKYIESQNQQMQRSFVCIRRGLPEKEQLPYILV